MQNNVVSDQGQYCLPLIQQFKTNQQMDKYDKIFPNICGKNDMPELTV